MRGVGVRMEVMLEMVYVEALVWRGWKDFGDLDMGFRRGEDGWMVVLSGRYLRDVVIVPGWGR